MKTEPTRYDLSCDDCYGVEMVKDMYGEYVEHDDYSKLEAERDRLRDALRWYERHVRDCNRKGKEGDDARSALAQDRGERARAALQEAGDDQ